MAHDHHHEEAGHGHPHPGKSDHPVRVWERREAAIRSLLIEKGLVTAEEIRRKIEEWEQKTPADGARVVARAWSDPAYEARLLADANAAVLELGIDSSAVKLVALKNTPRLHHLVVCTLCSCYPRTVLGLPPAWYKAKAYRSRAVSEPRQVLAEFGTVLPPEVELRVVDSTADCRYLVLPLRPRRQRIPRRGRARSTGDPQLHDRRRPRHNARLIMASGPGAPWRRFLLAGLIVAGFDPSALLAVRGPPVEQSGYAASSIWAASWCCCSPASSGASRRTPLSSLGKTLGQLAFWGAMVLLLIGGYSYRGELRPFADRILGELDPSRPRTDDSLLLRGQRDIHHGR